MWATLPDILRSRSQTDPELSFRLVKKGREVQDTVTFEQLDRTARGLALGLLDRGLGAGDRVVVAYQSPIDFVRAFWGCLYAGLTAVPAPLAQGSRKERSLPHLKAILEDCQPSAILSDDPTLSAGPTLLSLDCALNPDDWVAPEPCHLALLQYTSGSTRQPRGVMVTHANLLHNLSALEDFLRPGLVMHWLPLHHDMGLIRGMLSPLYMGSSCVMMEPMEFLQYPRRWLEAITEFRATITGAPNFGFARLTQKVQVLDGLDLSSLQIAFCSAEPIQKATAEGFLKKFASVGLSPKAFKPAYGLAEATVAVSGETRDFYQSEQDLVCCGQVLGEQELVVVDPHGQQVPPLTVGELWLRGPSVASGYWNKPQESRETFQAHLASGEGPYLKTGDLGFLDRQGNLTLSGRIKDLLILRGQNYFPHDLEQFLEDNIDSLRPGCTVVFERSGSLWLTCESRQTVPVERLAAQAKAALSQEFGLALHGLCLLSLGGTLKTASGKVQRALTKAKVEAQALQYQAVWARP